MCVSISNGTLFSQPVWMTLVLWSGWVSAFWVGEENWAFRDIWRQVIWCLEPGCDAFWVGISPLGMRDDKSWHYVWFPLMLWQAGFDLTKLSEVLRPRVGSTAVIKVMSVKIPELFVVCVGSRVYSSLQFKKAKRRKLKSQIFDSFYIFEVYIQSIVKNLNESVNIFMFSQAADGLFD